MPVSRLHASRTLDGWLRLDGLFAPDDAAIVDAALGAGVDRALRATRDGDPSVEGQPVSALRAGVLVDLAAQSMRQEPSDASVPDRYRVAVVVRPGEPTVPEEAACDAVAYRVTLGAEGEVLDVGRQTNQWPTAIRRAITVRDADASSPLRSAALVVRHPPLHPMGRRRRHLRRQRRPRSAGAITPSSTDNAGRSRSTTAGPSFDDPTAPPTPSDAGNSPTPKRPDPHSATAPGCSTAA